MEITEDHWLSAIFGHGVFKIDVNSVNGSGKNQEGQIWELVSRHAQCQSAAMYFAKVDTDNISVCWQLGLAGFYVVDVNVTFGIDGKSLANPLMATPIPQCAVGEISPQQYEDILEVAATSFKYSRFHLDPLIPNALANEIKRQWIGNYIRKKRGEQLLVASVADRAVGFLAVIAATDEGKRIVAIDLIGVSRSFQKQRIGQSLVAFFFNNYKNRYDSLRVGTQVANLPSIRLYQKMGFSLIKSAYVMHMHVGNKD